MKGIVKRLFIEKRGKMTEIKIRHPNMADAPKAMNYVNSLVEEGAMIARTKRLKLREEKDYFRKMLQNVRKKKEIMIRDVFFTNCSGSDIVNHGHYNGNKI